MPTSSSAVAVGTSAVKLAGSSQSKKLVYLQDGDYEGSTLTYVGGSDVTTGTGIKLSKINVTVFELYENDILFAISDGESGSVRVVEVD